MQKICKAAGVPKATAHGCGGCTARWAVDNGITAHAVASALGHESFRTTAESYGKREAVAGAQQMRALAVLVGRRRRREAAPSTPGRTTSIVPRSFPKPYFQTELKKTCVIGWR